MNEERKGLENGKIIYPCKSFYINSGICGDVLSSDEFEIGCYYGENSLRNVKFEVLKFLLTNSKALSFVFDASISINSEDTNDLKSYASNLKDELRQLGLNVSFTILSFCFMKSINIFSFCFMKSINIFSFCFLKLCR